MTEYFLPPEARVPAIVVKKQEDPGQFGKKPEKRTMEELLQSSICIIDKPAGPTSHQVSAYVKHIVKTKKTGHSGTLDPMVTGVLPVAIGKGTRIVQALLSAGKEYIAEMKLHQPVDEAIIKKTLEEFVGRIKQLPPVRSAVKREWRNRTIYYIEILDIQGQTVLFRVGCEAGTYIRKLIHDIGEHLKVKAHMTELRRTKAGPFLEKNAVSLQALQDAYIFYKEGNESLLKNILLPLEKGVQHLPHITITNSTVDSICHGATLKIPGIAKLDTTIKEGELVALMTSNKELVALAEAKMSGKQMLKNVKGVAAKSTQVFMQPGIYPKLTKEQ